MNSNEMSVHELRFVFTIATNDYWRNARWAHGTVRDNGTGPLVSPNSLGHPREIPLLKELLSARISFVSHVVRTANIIENLITFAV